MMRGYCQVCAQLIATPPHFRRNAADLHDNHEGVLCRGSYKPFRTLHTIHRPRHGTIHRILETVGMAVMVAASEWAPRHPGISVRSYPAPKALSAPRSIP